MLAKLKPYRKDLQWLSGIFFALSVFVFMYILSIAGQTRFANTELWSAGFLAVFFGIALALTSRGFARLGAIGMGLIVGSVGPVIFIRALLSWTLDFAKTYIFPPEYHKRFDLVARRMMELYQPVLDKASIVLFAGTFCLVLAVAAGMIKRRLSPDRNSVDA